MCRLSSASTSEDVETVLNFPRKSPDGKPPKVNMTGTEDPSLQTQVVEKSTVRIHDARQLEEAPTLDKQGFQLVQHDTDVDFEDHDQIRAVYYKQMEDLVCQVTGAERAVLFDHTVRKVEPQSKFTGKNPSAPKGGHASFAVNKVHGDYTASGAPRRVIQLGQPLKAGSSASYDAPLLTEEEAQEIVGNRRYMIVNVWRSISRQAPVKRAPLAYLDCSTVADAEEHFVNELIFKDRVGETLAVDEKAAHRWYYFPKMDFHEASLFRTFDSTVDPSITGRFCIHSAFDDPRTTDEDPTRESIEVRVLAVFPAKKTE